MKFRRNPKPKEHGIYSEMNRMGGCYATDDSSEITLPLPDSAIYCRWCNGFRVVLAHRRPVATGVSLS